MKFQDPHYQREFDECCQYHNIEPPFKGWYMVVSEDKSGNLIDFFGATKDDRAIHELMDIAHSTVADAILTGEKSVSLMFEGLAMSYKYSYVM